MPADLLANPRWAADQLGLPMPDDPHAVSACLPLWDHNIRYEEGDVELHGRLQAAYPRFAFHPRIRELCQTYPEPERRQWLPFASRAAAIRALEFVLHAGGRGAELKPVHPAACGVSVPEEHLPLLKQYWQHAGENVSSRVAERILQHQDVGCSETTYRVAVRSRLAELQQVDPANVFLYPSGMAAIAAAWRTIQAMTPGPTVQFGFPYVDTLKIQQRFPSAVHHFLPIGTDPDLDRLEELCEKDRPVAVFCEIPTNPLLICPNLNRLRELADQYKFLLVVDDTLGACLNLQISELADLVVTSLTKYFSGYGNVLAGSLVVNPVGPRSDDLQSAVADCFEETLSDADVKVLHENSIDLEQRIATINSNAAAVVDFLKQHPTVERVYYPSPEDPCYAAVRHDDGGFGGLFSVLLKQAAERTPAVYDRLKLCKGPNLGTYFTLCCPYTILAHYDELDFVEDCGVSRWLLRVSVGTEPQSELIDRFASALNAAPHR